MRTSLASVLAGLAATASAAVLEGPRGERAFSLEPTSSAAVAYNPDCYWLYPVGVPCPIEAATFDQLIDHDDPSLGTFKQRYWVNNEFYAGQGAPIVVNAPGENAADYMVWYGTNWTLPGTFAQKIKGAAIVMEHRYWGDSLPFDKMTTKNLRYLTLDNAMRDIIYFARNVKLSFDKDGSTHPDNAPWVLSGGSYPGALTAWINFLYPGTFWAYHATSAVVESIADYWQYYVPIESAMPRNCSSDLKKIIKNVDEQLDKGDEAAKTALKAKFGLAGLADDDFGYALSDGLQSWQGTQFYTGPKNVELYEMCDWIEGVGGSNGTGNPVPDEKGVGKCAATANLARWYREVHVPWNCNSTTYWAGVGKDSVACWDTHNKTSPYFTDRSTRNSWNLQWQWMLCNEPFQLWQGSFPGDTGLVSRYAPTQYFRDQCERFFPDEDGYTYGLKQGRTTEEIVAKTLGWNNYASTRLVQVNGEYDPWLTQTVSSPLRPGGPMESTVDAPIFVVPKAAHCSDLVMKNVNTNGPLGEIAHQVIDIIAKWVGEFYEEKGIPQPGF
ncbi:Peptidase S28 [Cordyceps fumosorosea ARSEF 2679]|uniref:Peptidase S28 n=1 Tax=Cordyceps fumosorosea (strain ARSEF 2679) TaxID=1081104 RepID=A0A167QMM1_CORFA|nr:Peptidase S28 [Cordyceps fumosorosea ARSEF 2679]OAA57779.1 Peptidase S28 [Cordyceps fumosorosea ARSEF 2679]